MSKLSTLAAGPDTASLLFPFIDRPIPNGYGGITLGPQIPGRKRVRLSPWYWQKVLKAIKATQCELTADLDMGKSTLVKSMIAQFMSMQGVPVNRRPTYLRVRIDSKRSEQGKDEYAPFVEAVGGLIFALKYFQINPLDPELFRHPITGEIDEADILEVAIVLGEIAMGTSLARHEGLCFQIGVYQMLQDKLPDPGYLEIKLRGLNLEDVDHYFNRSNSKLSAQLLAQHGNRPDLKEKLKAESSKPNGLVESEFRQDAFMAASRMGAVLRGRFGHSFGGNMSLREMTQPRLALRDWSGLNTLTQTALATVFNLHENIAIRQDRKDELPEVSFTDEQHAFMKNLAYASSLEERARMARQTKEMRFRINQYAGDTARVGQDGSALRGHGQAIDKTQGFLIAGRQPNDNAIKGYLYDKGVREPDVKYITEDMPEYCFALLLPNWAPIFFQRIVGPTVLKLAETNSASASMINPVSPYEDEETLGRFARIRNAQTAPPPDRLNDGMDALLPELLEEGVNA